MKKALASTNALNPWVLFLASLPSIFSGPLAEASGSEKLFGQLLIVSICSQIVAIGFMLLFHPLYKLGKARWWYTPIISAVGGAIKGSLTWTLAHQFISPAEAQGLPSLESRLIISSTSWVLFFIVLIVLLHNVLQLRDQNRRLKMQILDSAQNFESMEKQLEWLVKARVDGLSDELAKSFVSLVEKLNNSGGGPKAYRDIASELRKAARGDVRSQSAKVWHRASSAQWGFLWSQILNTPANAIIAAAFFGLSASVTSIRAAGIGLELFEALLSTAILYAVLQLTRRRPAFQHLAAVGAASVQIANYWLTNSTATHALQVALSSLIWSELSILMAIAWPIALKLARQERNTLLGELGKSESEINWLALQVESTNLEIAKYIHAILQTRLMAHAMKFEQGEEPTAEDLAELENLLTSPLSGFGSKNESLEEGLADLISNWQNLVEIDLENNCTNANSVEATLQVVREALVNSVRHGMAESINVRLNDTDDVREIVVTDNGIGPTKGSPGLGNQIFSSLCLSHKLTKGQNGGCVFTATLAI